MFYIPCLLPLLLYLNLFFQTFSIKRKSFTNSSCFVNSISPMSSSNIFTSPGNPEFTKWMSFMKKIFLQVLFLIFHRYYILKQKVSLAKNEAKAWFSLVRLPNSHSILHDIISDTADVNTHVLSH